MEDEDLYFELDYVLQVRFPHRHVWENMAAFNVKSAALAYRRECISDDSSWGYRLWERVGNRGKATWTVIACTDTIDRARS